MEIDFTKSVPLYPSQMDRGRTQTAPEAAGQKPEIDFSRSAPVVSTQTNEPSWGKTIASGAAQGIASIPGMVGDVRTLVDLGIQKGGSYLQSKITGEDRAAIESRMRQKSQDVVDESFLPKVPSPPGSQDIISAAMRVIPSLKGTIDYEPQTLPEKLVKGGISFAAPSLIGPLGGMATRGLAGFTSGAGSEYAGEATKNTPYELPARVAGAVLGGMGGRWAASTAEDIAKGTLAPAGAAKERLAQTVKNYDVESAPLAQTLARSPGLKESADAMTDRMRNFTQNLLKIDEAGPQFMNRMEELGSAERKRVYDLARSAPAAASIQIPALDMVRSRGIFREAEDAAMKNAADVPQWGIVAPTGKRGGNLSYYDQVKQELDSIIEQAARTGDTTRKVAAQTARRDMLDILDPYIPQYREARGIASDTFKAQTAPQAGARFFTQSDDYKLDEFKKAFNSFNPEQRQGFALGFMTRMEQELATKNPTVLVNKLLNNRQFKDKMQFAFGKEQSDAIRAKVLSENLIQQADKIRAQVASSTAAQQAASPLRSKAVGAGSTMGLGAAAFEYQAIIQMLTNLGLSPVTATAALAGTGAAVGKALVMSKVEQRVANRMLQLMQSNDPKMYGEINRLIDKNPAVYNKMLSPLLAIQQSLSKPEQERPQRASGGRLNAVSKADMIIAQVDKARRELQRETGGLLNHDDSTIVKALKVANERI